MKDKITKDYFVPHRVKPYPCPICHGTTQVSHGFYSETKGTVSINSTPEQCRTCWGRGIVWGYR